MEGNMYEKIVYFSFCIAVLFFAITCAGCQSAPVVIGGSEEIGELRARIQQYEEQYSQLERDYNGLITRQRELTIEQSGITEHQQGLVERHSEIAGNQQGAIDRIGEGITRIQTAGNAISESADRLAGNNQSVIVLLQHLVDYYAGPEGRNSGVENQTKDSSGSGYIPVSGFGNNNNDYDSSEKVK
jgi:chromosome segregation ATPase